MAYFKSPAGRVSYVRQRDRANMQQQAQAQAAQAAATAPAAKVEAALVNDTFQVKRIYVYSTLIFLILLIASYLTWKVCKKD